MNDDELILPPAEPGEPRNKPKIEDLIAVVQAQQKQIMLLNESVQRIALRVEAPGVASPPVSAGGQTPSIAGPSGMGEMMAVLRGFVELQNTMKQGILNDLQVAAQLGGLGGMEEPESSGWETLAEALAPAAQAYVQAKIGAPNTGSVGGGSPGFVAPSVSTIVVDKSGGEPVESAEN